MQDRNAIRAAIFNQSVRSKIVQFAGVDVEIRQPAIGAVLDIHGGQINQADMATRMLLDYCFVPGTNEKVFEPADAEAIHAMPFNADWTNLTSEINALTGIEAALGVAKGN